MFSYCHFFNVMFTMYTLLFSTTAAQKNYKIILEDVKNCLDKGTGEIFVKSKTTTDENGDMSNSGHLRLPYGITDSMKAVSDASIWKDNEWQPIGLVWKLPFERACTDMKKKANSFFDILRAADVDPIVCPVPKGTYHYMNMKMTDIKGVKTLNHGKYRVRVHFTRKGTRIGCICYIAQVVSPE